MRLEKLLGRQISISVSIYSKAYLGKAIALTRTEHTMPIVTFAVRVIAEINALSASCAGRLENVGIRSLFSWLSSDVERELSSMRCSADGIGGAASMWRVT